MRIATLLPSATEIVGALGLADHIVAISHECDVPVSVTDRPRVTSTTLDAGLTAAQIDAAVASSVLDGRPLYAVDAERLRALKPDLLVTQGVCDVCAVGEDVLAPVRAVIDVPVVSLGGMDFAGVCDDIRTVGEATGRVAEAEALVASLRARWTETAVTRRPRVLFVEWHDPLWIGGHWVPEQIAAAGGRDLFGEPGQPSRRLAWDDAVAATPEIVVVGSCGTSLSDNVAAARGLASRFAGAAVVAIDANHLASRPAPSLVRGMEVLRAIFSGKVEEVSADEAYWVRRADGARRDG